MDKRLGYHRDERNHKTPEHDEMCMFVHDNYQEIVDFVLFGEGIISVDDFDEHLYTPPKFEEPVTFQKNKYNKEQVIGYIDISTGAWIEDIGSFEDYKTNPLLYGKWYYNSRDQSVFKPINFEIKPRIDSVGDVIRQIQYYKTYDEKSYATQWVIITKTKGLRKYFESQGIVYFEYDEIQDRLTRFKEKIKMREEKLRLEEVERVAEEQRRTKARQEKIDKFKTQAKGFVTGLFKSKEAKVENEYECIQCGRVINHVGRCLPCNAENKRKLEAQKSKRK